MVDFEWIEQAVKMLNSSTFVDKLESPDGRIKVYRCGLIIRIDIKL
jgi:hypothetical protein